MLMAILPTKRFPKAQEGLTLIEVLIALAIIAIALTAVIKATSHSIRSTAYLEDKAEAGWVAQQIINEIRVGVLKLPESADSLDQSTQMLGRDWYWSASQQATPNRRIKKIIVSVYRQAAENTERSPIITLESYTYDAKN